MSPEATFFMLVTPRDAVIADYAVRSYAKIRALDFRLAVYSNFLLPEQKAYFFPRWERFPFVQVMRNDHHDADLGRVYEVLRGGKTEGPFEHCDSVWDRELPKIDSRFVATVDADFEILDQAFVHVILDALRSDDKLIAMSTDHSDTTVWNETYSSQLIVLCERFHTWFCVYKREAFSLSSVSHNFYKEPLQSASEIKAIAWDSSGYFQQSLRALGYTMRWLPERYRRQYVHYGAFSKNTTITRENVAMWRRLALTEHLLPPRLGWRFRKARLALLPRLENSRLQLAREAPIAW